MRTYDLTPFYRSTVGFDRLFDLLDTATKVDTTGGYPPYNIERTGDDTYRISMAVAGFSLNDLKIEVKENALTVAGEKADGKDEQRGEFLHRGIANRAFERQFQLADHVVVTDASLENGLLHIDLERRVPEEKKAKLIAIKDMAKGNKLLGGRA